MRGWLALAAPSRSPSYYIFLFNFRHIGYTVFFFFFFFFFHSKFIWNFQGIYLFDQKLCFFIFPISLFIYSGFQFFFFFSFCTLCLIEEPKRLNWKKKLQQIRRTFYFFKKRKISCLRKTHIPHVKLLERKKKEIDMFFFFFFKFFFNEVKFALASSFLLFRFACAIIVRLPTW